MTKRITYVKFIAFFLLAFGGAASAQQNGTLIANYSKSKLEAKTLFTSSGNLMGFEIYADGKMIFSQTQIKGVEGSRGFTSKDQTLKIADIVIQKLKQGKQPSVVTLQEAQSINKQ